MKKAAVLATVALLASAGMASAQTGAAAAATLHLRIVPVDVTSASPLNLAYQSDNQHNTVLTTDLGTNRTRRFSVQYQIQEGVDFQAGLASLASMQFNITGSLAGGTLSNWGVDRALLTAAQSRTNLATNAVLPVGATDNSGDAAGTFAGITGLWRTYRGGLSPSTAAGNGLPSNGTIAADGIYFITPLTLSQLNQYPANDPTAWYGLYDFNVIVGDNNGPGEVTVNLAVNAVVDGQTGNAWGGYEDGDVIPRTSQHWDSAGASFNVEAIPAPGALALVGLGGLVAARRRRA